MTNKAVKFVFGAKENGSPETLVVNADRLKNVLYLAGLLAAASSMTTFVLTGQKQVDGLRGDFGAACAKFERKDMEHDAALSLIAQRLDQMNGNMERLLDIALEQRTGTSRGRGR